MAFPAFLAALIQPISSLISETIQDKDKAAEINAALAAKILSGQSEELAGAIKIILAEAQGESWLQRNWRPLMMVWFGVLLGMYWFGVAPPNLTQATIDQLFNLLQLGIGGYVVGRSAEKIVPQIVDAIKSGKGN